MGVSPYSMKIGANTASSSRNYVQQTAAMQANKAASTSTQGMQQQPMVIPNSAGFPPRSLHAYIPGLPVSSFTQKSNSSTSNAHRHQVSGCSKGFNFRQFLEGTGKLSTPKYTLIFFLAGWLAGGGSPSVIVIVYFLLSVDRYASFIINVDLHRLDTRQRLNSRKLKLKDCKLWLR